MTGDRATAFGDELWRPSFQRSLAPRWRSSSAETQRHAALADLLTDWEHEFGAVDADAISATTHRYHLDS